MQPELIADYQCVTGEGPLWHPQQKCVYWVDIPAGKLFRYFPDSGHHELAYQDPEALGGFTLQDDGSLLLFMARGAVKTWRDGEITTIIDEIPAERESRFNDVFADPEGRVFCGTMPSGDKLGRLYRLDPDRTLTVMVENVTTSNGMGLTPDRKQLYYADTRVRKIYIFDYDQKTGNLSNQRVFLDLAGEEGMPDGMTVDAEGYVWSAFWDGWVLVRYSPDGREDMRIRFPAKKVSSVTFGGPDYKDMYVTTAGGPDKTENGPGAGALFRLRLGIQGVPEFTSKIR
jgi:sugar lactone lactonase YvrE